MDKMKTRSSRALLFPFLLVFFAPRPCLAQLSFLDKVFGKVTAINAQYVWATPMGNRGILTDSRGGLFGGLRGASIEVISDLGDFIPLRRSGCKTGNSSKTKETPSNTTDTTLTEIRVKTHDSVFVSAVRKKRPSHQCALFSAELGFGYSQLRGFRADTLGLQGSIEELPSLSFYLSAAPWSEIQPYFGVRTGLTQLKNFRATVNDTLLNAAGSTFQIGGVAGISGGNPEKGWSLFLEMAWTYRDFEGVTWSGIKSPIPPILLQPLRPYTRSISFGGQIALPEHAP
jgi:hypothetical protein